MATPTMNMTVLLPGGVGPSEAQVAVSVVAGDPGDPAFTGADETLFGTSIWDVAADGTVSFTNMRPTSGTSGDQITAPVNARYKAVVYVAGQAASEPIYFTVPDTAGSYEVSDYLSTAPTNLAPVIALNGLSDVSADNPTDNYVLTYDSATSTWGPEASGAAGQIATDTIWTAKGDLVAATGNDTAVKVDVGTNGQVLSANSAATAGVEWVDLPAVTQWATFDQAGTLTTGTGAGRYYLTGTWTIASVRASVGTSPSGASIVVDVNKNGTTIFTTQSARPEIADSTNTDTATPSVTSITTGDYLTVDIDQIGSSVAGADLTVQIELTQ